MSGSLYILNSPLMTREIQYEFMVSYLLQADSNHFTANMYTLNYSISMTPCSSAKNKM
ncbi:MAG: hypothetical protein LUH01_02795 [Parabacteroides gordonii]|nr:hypothetical protein [Parabacteroides gordonii]